MGALVIDYKDMLERAAVSQNVCNEHNKANLRRAKLAHSAWCGRCHLVSL